MWRGGWRVCSSIAHATLQVRVPAWATSAEINDLPAANGTIAHIACQIGSTRVSVRLHPKVVAERGWGDTVATPRADAVGIAARNRRLGNVDFRHVKHGDSSPARVDNFALTQYRSRPLHQPEPEAGLARHAAALETDRAAASGEYAGAKRALLGAIRCRYMVQVQIDEL